MISHDNKVRYFIDRDELWHRMLCISKQADGRESEIEVELLDRINEYSDDWSANWNIHSMSSHLEVVVTFENWPSRYEVALASNRLDAMIDGILNRIISDWNL